MTFLPSLKITIGEVTYFIHGLIHGNPIVSISAEFKKLVNDELAHFNVICEDGFTNWITNSKSFNEAEYFGLNKCSFKNTISIIKNFFYNKYIIRSHKTDLATQAQKIKTIEDFLIFRKHLTKNYPCEPEGMNSLLLLNNNGSIEKPFGELPLRIKRYIYEAQESIKYAKSNSINELHIVVGCAHELPLEYLLKNPKILKCFKV